MSKQHRFLIVSVFLMAAAGWAFAETEPWVRRVLRANFDTSTTFPLATTKMVRPNGPISTQNGMQQVDEQCVCQRFTMDLKMADNDTIYVDNSTADAAGGTDIGQLGIFNAAGSTRYFQCALTGLTSTGVKTCANGITSPGAMLPGDYWFCQACSDPSDASCDFRLAGLPTTAVAGGFCKFAQACTNGVIPVTLTAPACTWDYTVHPATFTLLDDLAG